MKNSLNVFLLFSMLFLTGLVNAQSGKKVNMKKPESVSLAFMKRFIQFEFESAKTLTTEESKQLFSLLEMAMNGMGEDEMKKAKEDAAKEQQRIKHEREQAEKKERDRLEQERKKVERIEREKQEKQETEKKAAAEKKKKEEDSKQNPILKLEAVVDEKRKIRCRSQKEND
jgi:hypothetical protein